MRFQDSLMAAVDNCLGTNVFIGAVNASEVSQPSAPFRAGYTTVPMPIMREFGPMFGFEETGSWESGAQLRSSFMKAVLREAHHPDTSQFYVDHGGEGRCSVWEQYTVVLDGVHRRDFEGGAAVKLKVVIEYHIDPDPAMSNPLKNTSLIEEAVGYYIDATGRPIAFATVIGFGTIGSAAEKILKQLRNAYAGNTWDQYRILPLALYSEPVNPTYVDAVKNKTLVVALNVRMATIHVNPCCTRIEGIAGRFASMSHSTKGADGAQSWLQAHDTIIKPTKAIGVDGTEHDIFTFHYDPAALTKTWRLSIDRIRSLATLDFETAMSDTAKAIFEKPRYFEPVENNNDQVRNLAKHRKAGNAKDAKANLKRLLGWG